MTAVNTVLNRLGLERLRLGSFGSRVVLPPAVVPDAVPLPRTWKHRRCRACDVTWTGLPECWCCGKPSAGIG